MLTPDEAADIAAKNGLSIADAVALRVLVDDVPEAEAIARKFASSDADRFVEKLFTPTDEKSRSVEVTNPDGDLRAATAKLFGS